MTDVLVDAWIRRRVHRTFDARAWRQHARPEQVAGDTARITYFRGGRGSGKSWGAVHNFAEWLVESPGVGEWGIVARTFGDARSMAIESPDSGLLLALGTNTVEIESGKSLLVKSWNRSIGELTMRSGDKVYIAGADNGAVNLQSKNLRGVWADEIGLWDQWQVAWDESIRMGTRKGGSRIIATGTPKAVRRAAKLVRRLINDPQVDNRIFRTIDNRDNLSDEFLEDVTKNLTARLSRQELEGELLDQPENALWTWDQLGDDMVTEVPRMVYVVIAVDPAVTSEEDSDETGIVVVGKGADGHGYVLADLSMRGTPAQVSAVVCQAFHTWRANWVVAEVNNGGDWIGALIHGTDPNVAYRKVTATRGKYVRAEPIAALYEQHRVHHVGHLPDLEDQMCSFEPGTPDSPDRMDALVWGLTACKVEGVGMTWAEVYRAGTTAEPAAEAENPWMATYSGAKA